VKKIRPKRVQINVPHLPDQYRLQINRKQEHLIDATSETRVSTPLIYHTVAHKKQNVL